MAFNSKKKYNSFTNTKKYNSSKFNNNIFVVEVL